MNLLLINYEYPPIGGGAANATRNLAERLAAAGHTVTVLTSQFQEYRGTRVEAGVTVVRCASRRRRADCASPGEMLSFLCRAAGPLGDVLRADRCDGIVAFFAFPCGPLGLLARLRWDVPYVVSLRGGDVPGLEPSLHLAHWLLTPLRRWVYRRSLAVTVNSEGLRQLSERSDRHSVRVIPNGVNTDWFRPAGADAVPARPFTFLFAGRFQRQKNLFFLLEQFARLRQTLHTYCVLRLVGDGPQRDDLRRHAEALGIADALAWHGWLDKEALLGLYRTSDCFLNPSLYEGMPNTVLEAMACALPVVASRVAGNDALVRPGETGFLFDLDHPEEFAAALQRLVADPALARRLGAAGRARAVTEFSWERVATQYAALFAAGGAEEPPGPRASGRPA